MPKILHTADIHLGAQFAVLGEKAQEYREQLKKTFVKIIDLALKQKVDLVLIAGDLFDSNFPADSTINLVKGEFKRLADKDIKLAILPGTHDYLNDQSVYLRENFGDNVFVFKKPESRVYSGLDLTLWAKPNTVNQSTESPLINTGTGRRPIPAEKTKYNIAMAHGSVLELAPKVAANQFPMHLTDITENSFDYIALGHWHSLRKPEEFKNKACYPGSPEPLNFAQSGAGYVVMVETGDPAPFKIRPMRIGAVDFDELIIDLGLIESQDQVKQRIVKNASENLIRQVKLQGLASAQLNLDLPNLEKDLSGKFFRLIINDQSQIASEKFEAGQYPQELVIGQFVRLMQERLKIVQDERGKRLVKQAMQIGLAALTNENFAI